MSDHNNLLPCPHCYHKGTTDKATNLTIPGDGLCKQCQGTSKDGSLFGSKGSCTSCLQQYDPKYGRSRGTGKCNACKGTGRV